VFLNNLLYKVYAYKYGINFFVRIFKLFFLLACHNMFLFITLVCLGACVRTEIKAPQKSIQGLKSLLLLKKNGGGFGGM